uniref:N-acetyltransferase domain-containing protein n=1 Tax=Palpitomonas bilix TaxID=652834 RepID=A0A7S3GF22_9EUKA|mmetsp:Transcript_46574/g.120178  ORF Transcript_46574/g.120178 Transcript_46574/m.120178 type:complete len:170 (+) Transcript_46574:96-605(+)
MKYMLLEDLKMELKAATLRDVEQLHSLELEGFPLDEAATMEGIRMRIEKAGDFFWLGEKHGTTVGFVNGTLTVGDFLSHESMSSHNAAGETLCIHSVCIRKDLQRQGLGTALLSKYVEQIRANQQVKTVLLLCKPNLINFYERAGFYLVGPSDVVHGKDKWMEMKLALR